VFDELGQTWSTPAIVNLRKFGTATNYNPALIFGGGYDPAEDTVPPSARSMGRALYVVNGSDASVVQAWGGGSGKSGSYRTANTIATYAIPSDVAALNTTSMRRI
jgi:Tfp pilus tip-associated adhesin PilY1